MIRKKTLNYLKIFGFCCFVSVLFFIPATWKRPSWTDTLSNLSLFKRETKPGSLRLLNQSIIGRKLWGYFNTSGLWTLWGLIKQPWGGILCHCLSSLTNCEHSGFTWWLISWIVVLWSLTDNWWIGVNGPQGEMSSGPLQLYNVILELHLWNPGEMQSQIQTNLLSRRSI